MSWYYDWKPYVSVAERRRRARKKMDALRRKGVDIQPITIDGRKIAKTFWGEAWCDHLESFSDYENRLPRGRTYVRNGSVCHLSVAEGRIEAKVSGTELYNVCIQIKKLSAKKWNGIKQRCAGQIGSLLELLQGRLSSHVMGVVTDQRKGLFPLSGEISLRCDCPDGAVMCKHVAAVLYGVGARLDHKPELLFTLRGVNHEELIAADAEAAVSAATSSGKSKRLAAAELSDVFGIDLDTGNLEPPLQSTSKRKSKNATAKPAKKRRVRKTAVAKKAPWGSRSKTSRKTMNKTAQEKPRHRSVRAGEIG
ncbi:MAG: SWIM zinc finger family protein [Planctomycetes bacterium]|nr:SWIM zinc finger family protein [Planctomycetota bacterium]MBU4399969.1 SWIM zinc finger family protein [Planctomycetota bacterium]MCG2684862.1 SWIM zinc finger family protein [Planctomycetales bacterium]